MIALAAGGGGSYTTLELPGTTARQLLVPAVTALFFGFVREPSWPVGATLAAAGLGLAFVHPTYALFVALPLAGFALVRLLAAADLRANALGLAPFGRPSCSSSVAPPIVARDTLPQPGRGERGAGRASTTRPTSSCTRRRATTSRRALVARTGAIAVAALVLVPLAALAARRRWSALVLGGTVARARARALAVVFPHFSDLVSLSQSRRAAGFVPFAFALRRRRGRARARCCASSCCRSRSPPGSCSQLEYPGDFGLRLAHGGPAVADVDRALGRRSPGIAVAVVLARRWPELERAGWRPALAALALRPARSPSTASRTGTRRRDRTRTR